MKHQDFWAGQTASASAARSFRFSVFGSASTLRFSVFGGVTTIPVVPSAISGGGARFSGAVVLTYSLAGREAGGEDGDENEEAVLHWVG